MSTPKYPLDTPELYGYGRRMEKLTQETKVRLSDSDHALAKERAAAENMPLATWMRLRLSDAVKSKPGQPAKQKG